MSDNSPQYTIFQGRHRLLQGDRQAVLQYLQHHDIATQGGASAPLWVFDDQTGLRLDLDWRRELAPAAPDPAAAPEQASPAKARSVGRPKLGVISREVTLLPRHWEWLGRQPGGASGTLRRLIDDARNASAAQDALRAATEASYRFMNEMAGDLPGFEEACRALFARQYQPFVLHTQSWPGDVLAYLHRLSQPVWQSEPSAS
ncbi:DUF2239 family protein [Comamonas humi]